MKRYLKGDIIQGFAWPKLFLLDRTTSVAEKARMAGGRLASPANRANYLIFFHAAFLSFCRPANPTNCANNLWTKWLDVHKRQKTKTESRADFLQRVSTANSKQGLENHSLPNKETADNSRSYIYNNLCLSLTLSLSVLVTLPFLCLCYEHQSHEDQQPLAAEAGSSHLSATLSAGREKHFWQAGNASAWIMAPSWSVLHPTFLGDGGSGDAGCDLGNYPNTMQLFFVSLINSMLKIVV